jgi:hypothetical protein
LTDFGSDGPGAGAAEDSTGPSAGADSEGGAPGALEAGEAGGAVTTERGIEVPMTGMVPPGRVITMLLEFRVAAGGAAAKVEENWLRSDIGTMSGLQVLVLYWVWVLNHALKEAINEEGSFATVVLAGIPCTTLVSMVVPVEDSVVVRVRRVVPLGAPLAGPLESTRRMEPLLETETLVQGFQILTWMCQPGRK